MEIPVPAFRAAEIPGEVIQVGIPVVAFPAQVMATGPVQVVVTRAEIPDLAFPAEAFPVRSVAEGGDFVGECRTVVSRTSACRQVGVASLGLGAGH